MNRDEINQEFQKVGDSIALVEKEQEEEVASRVAAIREDAMKLRHLS